MDSENHQVVKKKRGRKPKEKKIEEEKIPKKRGRKPTGKLIKIKNTELSNLKNDDNCLIAHIPLTLSEIGKLTNKSNNESFNDTETSLNEISLENEFTSNKSNFNNKYIDHLEDKIDKLKDKINKLENEKTTGDIFFGDYSVEKLESKIISIDNNKISLKNSNCLCWWCCHNFDNTPFVLPDKLYNNKYYVFGNFCSPSCACAFNIDLNDHKLWERNSLILKLANELNENKVEEIYPSPPKQILNVFGGNITIDEFRKRTNKIYNGRLIIPPMVPLTTLIEESYKDRNKYQWENKTTKYNTLKNNIKIKKSITDTNLEKIMGIKKIKLDD
jgi:hypothetical protein